MDKKAKTEVSIHPLLEERWSPRSFREEEIPSDKLLRILEAARWAPSAFNEQPWRYIIGVKNNGSTYQNILDSLRESNKEWAYRAPVLAVCLAKKLYSHNQNDNFHFLYDAGQSVAHITFQAMYEGLYVHQMAGFYFEKIVSVFQIPHEFYVASVIAIGYLDSPEQLSAELYKREIAERNRKEKNELFFKNHFGESFFNE